MRRAFVMLFICLLHAAVFWVFVSSSWLLTLLYCDCSHNLQTMHTLWCLPFLTIALPWLRAINTPYCSWTSFSESCCAHGHGARRISQTFGERQPGCLGWSQSPCCTSIIELHACCCCTKRSKAQVIHEGFSWTVGPRGQGTSERTTTTATTIIIQQRDMTKEYEITAGCSSFHPIYIVIWRSQCIR